MIALTLAALVAPVVVQLATQDARTAVRVLFASITAIGLAGVLMPWLGTSAARIFSISTLALPLAVFVTRRKPQVLPAWMKSEGATRVTYAILPPLVLFGWVEWSAWIATDRGWLTMPTPIKTMYLRPDGQPDEHEDWRVYHMHSDTTKEPDPVLLWKPIASDPFNEQRFQGPVVEIPKPPGVFRVMVYGDSNTAMPGAWPMFLRELVTKPSAHHFEIVNAGVEGYSSYQGLMRFRQERETYQPDMILVSFGWNDVAPAIDKQDKDYLPPTGTAGVLRAAMRYRSYRLFVSRLRPKPPPRPNMVGSRVGLDDYKANLRAFVSEGRRENISVVLLTRPHVARIADDERWVKNVPSYNQAVLAVAEETGTRAFDSNGLFRGDEARFLPGDECHLLEDGHRELAKKLCEQLFPVACPRGK